jgi:NAD-dependent deacetylase
MENIKGLAELIKKSDNIVFFTGAGVSTDSGIPDFRSKDTGLWNLKGLGSTLDIYTFTNNPKEFYEFAIKKFDFFLSAQPNISHNFITKLQKVGKVKSIITQNVDGLHQKSGSENVIELHGNMVNSYCVECGHKIKTKQVFNMVKKGVNPPSCPICNNLLRPEVVFFGEDLPASEIERAVKVSKSADLFIVMGSSLVVMPAALMPGYAKSEGIPVVILNKMETPYDSMADIVINDKLSNIISAIEVEYGI